MSTTCAHAPRVHARQGFTEENIWRDALGGREPLLVFVTYGPLDAPEWMPAGGSSASQYGPQIITCMRPGYWE